MDEQNSSGVLLSATELGMVKRGNTILNNVSLALHESEIITVIGPNGAGKTSLVRALLGLQKATQGRIYRKPGLRVGYVPQRAGINHLLPLRVIDFLKLAGNYTADELAVVMHEVDVSNLLKTSIQNLSGGELQRVLLARALLKKPQLLVLDEPAQGLDVIGQQALYQTIRSIRDAHQCGILMVSHDLHLVMSATDQVICMNTHVCCTGHPDHVSAHPEYLKLFGTAMDELALYSHHHDHEHDVHGDVIPVDQHEAAHGNAHKHEHCDHG